MRAVCCGSDALLVAEKHKATSVTPARF